MNIAIVYHGTYPFNRGVDQLAQTLRSLGNNPTIVAKKPHQTKKDDMVNGIRLLQVPLTIKGMSANLVSYHFPLNPYWSKLLVEFGRRYRWKAVFVREIPLAWPVLKASRILNIPAFLDMRENLSAMYEMGQPKNPVLSFIRNKTLVRLYESFVIKKFNHVFTVSKELKDWLLKTYQPLPQNISVLENVPTRQFLNLSEKFLNKPRTDKDVRLVYAGWITENKGLGLLIGSLPHVLRKYPKVSLRIIGEGPYLSEIRKSIRKLKLENSVEIYPLLPMNNLVSVLSECDIGLETCKLNELTHQTTPGKLFEYMALGLPVLSSARRPVIRILNETGAGRVYTSRSPERVADTILEMIKNKQALKEMGEKARAAIISKYNWKRNEDVLRKALREIENR